MGAFSDIENSSHDVHGTASCPPGAVSGHRAPIPLSNPGKGDANDPIVEARHWVQLSLQGKEHFEMVVVLGLGTGYRIVELCRQIQKRVMVFEPRADRLKAALALPCFQEVLEQIQVMEGLEVPELKQDFVVLEQAESVSQAPEAFEVIRLRLWFQAVKSVIAVQNYGSSGTLFMQSLLDFHPGILSTPALYSIHFFGFWKEYGQTGDLTGLINTFLEKHGHWFDPMGAATQWGLHQMGPHMDERLAVPLDRFCNALVIQLKDREPLTRKDFFKAMYVAYAYAQGRSLADSLSIMFPIHSNPRSVAQALVDDFPDMKFLHMIRDPIKSMGSTMKHVVVNKLPENPLECALAQLLNEYTKAWGMATAMPVWGGRPYFEHIPAKGVKLESLHADPQTQLKHLCHWCRIPWDDVLLESTFNGKKWWNRPESKRVSGFGGGIAQQQYAGYLNRFDAARLRCFAYPKLKFWRYPLPWYARFWGTRFMMVLLAVLPFKAEVLLFPTRYKAAVHTLAKAVTDVVLLFMKRLGLPRAVVMSLAQNEQRRLIQVTDLLFLLVLAPYYVMRDYGVNRWYLLLSLRYWFRLRRPEVPLLEWQYEQAQES